MKVMLKNIYHLFFVLIPFCFLLFLGFYLDVRKNESQLESRRLSEIPQKPFAQRKELETYISDHIPFREKILTVYFSFNLKLASLNTQNIVGKENWIFAVQNPVQYNLPVLKSYQNYKLLTHTEQAKIIENLKYMKKWCDENNVKFYLMFPPDKSRIYSRFMPDFILRKEDDSTVMQLKKQIPEDITVVPLEKELIAFSFLNNELLYYKDESHWSEEGAFFVYQQLMKQIKKDFSNTQALSKDNFFITKTLPYRPYDVGKYPKIGKGNQHQPKITEKDFTYNHFTYKNKNDIQIHWDKNFRHSTYNNGQPFNVYIIGDSYATYLHSFLSATFQRVRAFRFNMPKEKWGIQFNERIKEFKIEKPNILILAVSDLKLKDLLKVE